MLFALKYSMQCMQNVKFVEFLVIINDKFLTLHKD